MIILSKQLQERCYYIYTLDTGYQEKLASFLFQYFSPSYMRANLKQGDI